LLLPLDLVSFLVETILKTHGATIPEEDLALVRCMEWIDGNLSRLLFIDDLHPAEFRRVVNQLTVDRRESVPCMRTATLWSDSPRTTTASSFR
jgi:hypothetical protein